MSNRFVLVEREFIHPTIEGVDFGGKCWVIARSPTAVLIWVQGHSWALNGFQRYSGPHMTLLPNRNKPAGGWLPYKTIAEDVRLSRILINQVRAKLLPAFEDEAVKWIYLATGRPRHGGRCRLTAAGFFCLLRRLIEIGILSGHDHSLAKA